MKLNSGQIVSWIFCCVAVGFTSNTAVGQGGGQVVAAGAELKLVSADYKFTEGPAVDRDGNIYFTDQPNDRIMRWDTNGDITEWLKPAGRSNGLFFEKDGNLIACADGKNELWRIRPDKTHEVLLTGYDSKLLNGPNDVWVVGDGSMYFTDPFYKRPYWERDDPESQLPKRVYRLSSNGQVTVAAEDFKQPNGIVGDAAKRLLFVADIGDNKTYRFEIAEDGQLKNRRLFCEMGSDGMTLDQAGNLYLTGKAGVTVFNAEGKQVEVISVPENWTANVCFGGKDRKTLFITASDSVYTIEMQTAGLK